MQNFFLMNYLTKMRTMVNSNQNRKDTSPEDDFYRGPSKRSRSQKKHESRVLILDYLPEGKVFRQSKGREPIIQAIGTTWFTLLEITPKKRAKYQQFDKIILPEDSSENKQVKIKQRITINDLTNTSYNALEKAIGLIIKTNEKRFVTFFNQAQPITNRIHSLQLIPGIGKKLMWDIIKTRKGLPFISIEDIENRVKISDIQKMLTNRIMQELEGDEKHKLFTA